MFARGHFVIVEITHKMEGVTAILGGMAVLGALCLIVVFSPQLIVGTYTFFTLVVPPFCGVGCGSHFPLVIPSTLLAAIDLSF